MWSGMIVNSIILRLWTFIYTTDLPIEVGEDLDYLAELLAHSCLGLRL